MVGGSVLLLLSPPSPRGHLSSAAPESRPPLASPTSTWRCTSTTWGHWRGGQQHLQDTGHPVGQAAPPGCRGTSRVRGHPAGDKVAGACESRVSAGSRCTCHLGILPPPTTSTRHKPPRGAQSQGRSYTHLSSWHPTSRNNIHKLHTTWRGPEPGQVLDAPVIFLGPYCHEQHSLALPVLASQAAITNTTDGLG